LCTELEIKTDKVRILPAHAIKKTNLGDKEANQNAIKLLEIVTKVFNDAGINYYVDAGTLLGIVRDGALIPWDDDLDIAINSKQTMESYQILTNLLSNLELEFNTKWEVFINKARYDYCNIRKNDISSFKLRPVNLCDKFSQLDVFIKYIDSELMHYVISSRGFTMPSSHLLTTEKFMFNNFVLNIPSNAKSYLATHYGDDWHIPKKEWNLSMIKSAQVFES
jgi:phosphorylcholine metabolism protein LicD